VTIIECVRATGHLAMQTVVPDSFNRPRLNGRCKP
jgi:hypothetical protein